MLIGNVVEAYAKLVYTGRASMHVVVDVGASDPKDLLRAKTTRCVVVFVEDGRGRGVERYAVKSMKLRKGMEEEMVATLRGAAPL